MDDLDHVLGLLREADGGAAMPVPQRTLADLDRLLAETRATGLPVEARRSGDLAGLPAVVSREGYRIVQARTGCAGAGPDRAVGRQGRSRA